MGFGSLVGVQVPGWNPRNRMEPWLGFRSLNGVQVPGWDSDPRIGFTSLMGFRLWMGFRSLVGVHFPDGVQALDGVHFPGWASGPCMGFRSLGGVQAPGWTFRNGMEPQEWDRASGMEWIPGWDSGPWMGSDPWLRFRPLVEVQAPGWDSDPWHPSGAGPGRVQGRAAPSTSHTSLPCWSWHCQERDGHSESLQEGTKQHFWQAGQNGNSSFEILAEGLGCVFRVLMKGSRHKLG